ncbi:MAG: hypothetical protein HYT16_03185 [DPANN group archaeon]|nr:hypothetical protein [DPANN group archaeon]
MATLHSNAATLALIIVALVGILGLFSSPSFVTGAATFDAGSLSFLGSEGLLATVLVFVGIGLAYLFIKKSSV